VGPLGAAQLAEILAHNSTVKGLDLRGNFHPQFFLFRAKLSSCKPHKSVQDKHTLADSSPRQSFGLSPNFCWITCAETVLGSEGTIKIAQLLETNTSIRTLDLACKLHTTQARTLPSLFAKSLYTHAQMTFACMLHTYPRRKVPTLYNHCLSKPHNRHTLRASCFQLQSSFPCFPPPSFPSFCHT
jgi:hypothetical protein